MTSAVLPAHDPGLSSALLSREASHLKARVAFVIADAALAVPGLDGDRDGAVTAAEMTAGAARLRELASRWRLGGAGVGELVAHRLAENGDVELDLHWADSASAAVLEVPLLDAMARSHRHYVAMLDTAGAVIGDALLGGAVRTFAIPAPAAPARAGATFVGFVWLGVEHILLGFDHVCFLLGLLAVGTRLRRAAATITAFTVAHSLTLVGASLGFCALPAALVEPMIAASIVVVAVANLRRHGSAQRWPHALLFGLVHRFGFAAVLQDLQVGGGAIAAPLLGFNLGVELGQFAVAGAVLPALALARRRGHGRRATVAVSATVALAGAWWLGERLLALA
jgi:hypothetical protein